MTTHSRAAHPASCPAVAAFAALAFPLAASADVATDATPRHLDTVVVTAEAPVAPLVWETDPKLPRQPIPASDGADYLRTVPGFTAIRNGGTNGDPVLRGLSGSRLNLLTNDGAMPGACPARMDNPLSYVSPDTYDRLVIVKGPQTVLWGPGASAGTVRFVRDTPRFDAPGVEADASALVASHRRNDQAVDITAGGTRGYARGAANRSESGDYEDGGGNAVPSRWRKWSTDVALGWTPDADTVVELTAGRGDGVARYAGRGMDGAQFLRESLGLRAERTFEGGVLAKVQANLYDNRADHVMDNYTLREPNPMSAMPMPMAAQVERRTRGGRVAADLRHGAHATTVGVDGHASHHRDRSGMGRDTYGASPWRDDAAFHSIGAFAEDRWTLAPGAALVGGLRVDRVRVQDLRPDDGGMMMPMPNPTAGVTRAETLRAGFARIEASVADTRFGWYAGVGHTERMPDYWELFSANAGPTGSANAFAGVAPERTTQLDAGLQWRGEQVEAWMSAYAGRVDDFILFRYCAGGMMGSTTQAENVDARIRGGEAGLTWRPATAWRFTGTVAASWAENATDGTPLPQTPPLEGRLSAGYEGKRFSAGALLRGAARQSRASIGDGNVTGQDLGPTAGFGTLALNAGWKVDDRLQFTAGIDNVFDRTYAEHLNLAGSADFGYPADPVRIHEPGRVAWLRVAYRY